MIKHGKVNMEYSAATAIQTSSLGHEDALFAITVCLDHRLRIWNLEDGQILYTGDILNTERPPQEIGRWSIDPSQSNLVQIVGRNRGQRICATFSPVGAGEFKFWKIIAKDAHTIIVEDLFPQTALVPITPSTSDVWTLADFKLGAPVEGSINLWTLWKNNMTYRVQRLQLDRKDMARSWESGWDGVFAESAVATTPVSGPADASDVTENWLELILQPGRFSRPTLETALSIYERVLGGSREGGKGRSLAESVCALIGSTTTLDRGSSGTMEYDQFRASSETHWRRFYRVLMEMDKQRGEAIELALDPEADMAWVVCADLLSAVRECSDLEQVYHNISRPEEGREQQAALIDCAIAFVDGFSDNFLQLCNSVLRHEMYSEPSKTDFERIQYFSDKAGFWRGITEDDCAQVIDALGENFTMVTDELYEEMMDLFAAPVAAKGRKPRQPLTGFGRKLFLRATLGNLELHWKIAFSQLVLLVHMEFEFDKEEDALHHRVDIGLVFRQLISILQRLELVKWLANTELPVPLNSDKIQPITKKAKDETQLVTALEANIGHLLGFSFVPGESVGVCMSNLVTNFCAANSDIEVSPTLIQCAFMKRERADLALAMAPFCDQNPFSIYILGRVLLALKDFEGAAQEFRKAAIGMSKLKICHHGLGYDANYPCHAGTNSVSSDRHSCGLLDDNEWNLLNNGQGRYYSHIVALYEKHRAYFHVIDFSRLALQFLGTENDTQFTKTDLQSRMFNAAVATSQFELAHMSLQSFQDNVLRQSSLRKLVDRMCETSHNAALLELTFPEMQQEVDDILFQRCKSTMDVLGSQFHQVLYSWRIKRGNFRGAASVLLDRIEKLKFAGEADRLAGDDGLDTPVTKQYLLLINALSCVDPEQSWVFDEGNAEWERNGGAPTKRKVVSLADVRKQYQDELDRIAAIQNNQFSFAVDDVMEVA